jgi:hypothetical protein
MVVPLGNVHPGLFSIGQENCALDTHVPEWLQDPLAMWLQDLLATWLQDLLATWLQDPLEII